LKLIRSKNLFSEQSYLLCLSEHQQVLSIMEFVLPTTMKNTISQRAMNPTTEWQWHKQQQHWLLLVNNEEHNQSTSNESDNWVTMTQAAAALAAVRQQWRTQSVNEQWIRQLSDNDTSSSSQQWRHSHQFTAHSQTQCTCTHTHTWFSFNQQLLRIRLAPKINL